MEDCWTGCAILGLLQLLLLVTPFDIDADTFGKAPGTVFVVGNNGLLPLMICLMGTEMAAMGGAERIEVRDGDEDAVETEGGRDFIAVI